MSPERTLLERRVARALQERADALPERRLDVTEAIATHRRGRRVPVWLGVAAVVVVVLALVITRPFDAERGRPTGPTVTTVTTATTATTVETRRSPPLGAVGPEVPLALASNPDSELLVRGALRQNPAAKPVVVQIPGRAPIVVTGNCMMIAAAPIRAAGYEGSCAPRAEEATRIIGAPDTGPFELPTTVTYGAWLAVPSNAVVVTFSYGDQHTWQRPIEGVSYFTVAGSRPPLGSESVVLRAYDAQGRQVGEARATPVRDGQGTRRWG